MKALTLWQPWASLVEGCKPFEFRSWRAPRHIIGERIVIHAGARKPDMREVEQLLREWSATRPLPRRRCPCGRAYVLDGSPGEPCDLCKEEAYADAQRPFCDRCGDRGWVWHPDAALFANEWEAHIPCPVCRAA